MSEVTLNLTLEHLNTGTRFAFYNMGIIKLYGLGDEEKNVDEAAEWFLRSEMPEGIHTYSIWLESKGEHEIENIARDGVEIQESCQKNGFR